MSFAASGEAKQKIETEVSAMRLHFAVVAVLVFGARSLCVAETPVVSDTLAAPIQKPAPDEKALPTEEQRFLHKKCAELDRLQHEISQLRAKTGTPQQILVKVQILEVGLTKMRDHGIDTDWFDNAQLLTSPADLQHLVESARAYTHPSPNDAKTGNFSDSRQFVNWLRKQNLAKSLAEPAIVVVSGKPASLHVGGEFPVPQASNAKEAVGFRSYGTQVNVEVLAVGDNRVNLNIKARVSELDNSNAIDMNGIRIPGLRVRECDTGSELSFGQSMILTGLVQKRVEAVARVDGSVVENNVDVGLIMVVTPEVVLPTDIPPADAKHAVQPAAYQY
jgi:hypothetical protein